MNENKIKNAVTGITLPDYMADELLKGCMKGKRSRSFMLRYSKPAAAAVIAVVLTALSTTSYAAYNLYQVKNLRVFFDYDISNEQLQTIGDEINAIPGIYSIQFVNADKAWADFKRTCLSGNEELEEPADQFTENPLKDSYNYQVIVELNADTKEVKRQIEQLEGVRRVCDLKEAKELAP